ncbi:MULTISPECIES: zinc-ribbon domain-containing protein [Bifidobacterium]|uniref:Zinc-ribbon domain-containing protein n=1 Tax=Bifidobacterium reuteri DSM 23975 TaxID=1437610 RepID=A0A087CXC4_9BIFI|nr:MULTISPECIES: zinc-ribbon domain-containing protein [Bifidobacterium]TPF88671.1 hypothetical protein BW10_08545 [Bifidobacterium sp. UTBIF-56]TPF93746.1 hypothetical protein BW14_04415 [Bifidobacterium sp. UTBIF-68]KFI87924.1 hypothetical protein BREU_0701 [Bifidobacterium reuteri DSM 23975]TPF77649.1 hypothetical protein BW09_08615 [Bifidobacterium sp. UTCIF-1]TPF79947.1 hypothetical protein BW08_07410 [Bifidobacterium sp. UTCIF-24]
MKPCTQCGTSNPDEAKFCRQCGTPFAYANPVSANPVSAGPIPAGPAPAQAPAEVKPLISSVDHEHPGQ